jgi:hypothetical protein
MIKRLNKEAIIPSSDTIHNFIYRNFNDMKKNLKKELQEISSKISFSLDGWTSKNQIAFLCITGHWITNDWKLKCAILDFCQLNGPHSGANISEVFFNVLKDYSLLNKVSIIAKLDLFDFPFLYYKPFVING